MANRVSFSEQISLFRSQIQNRRFDDPTSQILESILVSEDVKSMMQIRSTLKQFMRDESLTIIREISEKFVDDKLIIVDFLVRVFSLIGDVESCLALRYEALTLRDTKTMSDPRLRVSCNEWLTFAQHSLDNGFYSIARKACGKALLSSDLHDEPEIDDFQDERVTEKTKRLKYIALHSASSQSVQAQATEYLRKKTLEREIQNSTVHIETPTTGTTRFWHAIRTRNLRKLHEHKSLRQIPCIEHDLQN